MCHKYSFVLTRSGEIFDGGGLTESHSEIASLHQVDEDKANKYEWRPPKNWPDAEVLDGLVKDAETFELKASALKKIAGHLTARFPDQAAFEAATPIDERWHEQKVTLRGREITIICRPTKLTLADGRFWVIGQTVEAWDNATVEAGGNATVVYPATWWHNKVNTDLKDKAVLIDRRDGRLVVSSPAEIQVIKCETPDAGE